MESVDRCIAGIDVHKKMLAVVIRKPAGQVVEYIKRKFGATKMEIFHLAGWLQHHQVSEVVMESTANYWRPVWYGLEKHLKLHLTPSVEDARSARTQARLSGRPAAGGPLALGGPGREFRSQREPTVLAVANPVTRAEEAETVGDSRRGGRNSCEGGIKLSSVVTDIFGVSGWAMSEKIAQGEEDIDELMGQARGRLKKKRAQLQEPW